MEFIQIPNKKIAEIISVLQVRRRAGICDAEKENKNGLEKYMTVTKYKRTSEYKNTLSVNCVKLYMLLHEYIIDKGAGKTSKIDVKELAEKLKCSEKTVINCLGRLLGADLIRVGYRSFLGVIEVTIVDYYKNMHKDEKERFWYGYSTYNKKEIEEICRIGKINELRTNLVAMKSIKKNTTAVTGNPTTTIIHMSDFLFALPRYVRPCHIRKYMRESSIIEFQESVLRHKMYVVSMKDGVDPNASLYAARKQARKEISDFTVKFDDCVKKANKFNADRTVFSEMLKKGLRSMEIMYYEKLLRKDKLPYLNFTAEQKDKLSVTGVDFAVEDVINAIKEYYLRFMLTEQKIESPPAVIRTIIQDKMRERLIL